MSPLNLMNDREELDGVMATSELGAFCDFLCSWGLGLALRLKTWTVPLSLETASH